MFSFRLQPYIKIIYFIRNTKLFQQKNIRTKLKIKTVFYVISEIKIIKCLKQSNHSAQVSRLRIETETASKLVGRSLKFKYIFWKRLQATEVGASLSNNASKTLTLTRVRRWQGRAAKVISPEPIQTRSSTFQTFGTPWNWDYEFPAKRTSTRARNSWPASKLVHRKIISLRRCRSGNLSPDGNVFIGADLVASFEWNRFVRGREDSVKNTTIVTLSTIFLKI